MERPKTENLTAWITGRNLNVFQKADAVIEYNKLLDYVKVIEEQLTIHSVVVTNGKCCDSIEQSGFYLGTTCPECKRPFRVPKVKQH